MNFHPPEILKSAIRLLSQDHNSYGSKMGYQKSWQNLSWFVSLKLVVFEHAFCFTPTWNIIIQFDSFFDSLKPPTRTQMRRMYRLSTYMKGEKWPHEAREWVGKYSHPMEHFLYLFGILVPFSLGIISIISIIFESHVRPLFSKKLGGLNYLAVLSVYNPSEIVSWKAQYRWGLESPRYKKTLVDLVECPPFPRDAIVVANECFVQNSLV